ncbi:unannotated protein [freshwater metagenome]|uniref:Unannotated protein n=1 Tax=freshwater metagenome TaxID=449393 RepID=A0A6J6APC4_9ZZZZ
MAFGGLGGRGEHRLGQLGRFEEPSGELLAMHRAVGLVFLPSRTGEIPTNDAFDGQHLGLAAQHDAALPVVALSWNWAVVERG